MATNKILISNDPVAVGNSVIGTDVSAGFSSAPLRIGATAADVGIQFAQAMDNTGAPRLFFSKTRGTLTSPTTVQTGDQTGSLRFTGYVGSTGGYVQNAELSAQVDGTVSDATNGLGGRLTISTRTPGGSVTERLRVDANGNVGIGTTNPSGIFHAEQNQNTTSAFYFTNTTAGSASRSRIIIGSDSSAGSLSLAMHSSSHATAPNEAWIWGSGVSTALILGTVGSERMRITPDSNVGIGTTNPTGKLHVSGVSSGGFTAKFEANLPYCWIQIKQTGGGANSSWQIGSYASGLNFYNDNNSAYRVFFGDNGQVGIGTTSPRAGYTFDVRGNIVTTGLIGFLGSNGVSNWGLIRGNDSGSAIVGDAQTLHVTSGGSVGIGTTSPASLLNIHGANPDLIVNNTGVGNSGVKIRYNGSSTHGLHLTYTPNDATAYIENTYQANQGTVYGDIYFRQNVAGSMTTRMMIKADGGNVGIGLTDPGSLTKLNVNGPTTLKRLQKQIYNWYTTSGDLYVHFKTNLKLSGSGAHVGMWVWRFYGYSYGAANIVDSYFSLHGDTSGNIYSPSINNQGEIAFGNNMYKSSDNFLVIVGLMDNTYFFGVDVDVHHTMTYGMIEFTISAVAQSTVNSGVY